MSRHSRLTRVSLLTFGSLLLAPPLLLAQSAPPSIRSGQTTAAPREDGTGLGDRFPVFAITGVEVRHSLLQPQIPILLVRGLTSSNDWRNGSLVPLTRGIRPDGVLDLVFVAAAPLESAAATGYTAMHATLPLPAEIPVKAIRVRSATNSVLLAGLSGAAEAEPPGEPCKACIGQYFVAKGTTAPTDLRPDQILRAEHLPPDTRIIQAADGITDLRRDPNRLTIVVGEDSRVADAVWE
ncbi:MAG: hypothetical protein AB7F35_24485 [Acetobacteraceae bacterium]